MDLSNIDWNDINYSLNNCQYCNKKLKYHTDVKRCKCGRRRCKQCISFCHCKDHKN